MNVGVAPELQAGLSPLERARANVAALKVLYDLKADKDRAPSDEERRTLSTYSGWGGAPDAFRESFDGHPAWEAVNVDLRELLSPDEYADARASTLTAFFTPRPVIDAMYGALDSLGFGRKGADYVLEPGCGTGNFIGSAPDGSHYAFTGVEMDATSSRIARTLHPQAAVVNAALEDCYVSASSFDAVVGNVPYSDAVSIPDNGRSIPVHDYFIKKSVEALRPGGVAALLTSRYTLDKASEATRKEIARQADLIGCVRLPDSTFKAQAGTEVVTDILILRKRQSPDESAEPDWVHTVDVGHGVRVNALFADGAARIVGHQEAREGGRFGAELSVTSELGIEEIGREAAHILATQVESLGDIHGELGKRTEQPNVAEVPDNPATLEYFLDEAGGLWYGGGEVVEAVPLKNAADRERLCAMVELRDLQRKTLAIEAVSLDEDEVARAIAALDAAYEGFVERFGRVNDAKNMKLFKTKSDDSISSLSSLEDLDSKRAFKSKADILSKRVRTPVPPLPEHLDDALDALTVSLDRTGRVDVALIASLLGTDGQTAVESLGERVITHPDTGQVVLAEQYLSGDVGAKLSHVEALLDEAEAGGGRSAYDSWAESVGLAEAARELSERPDVSGIVDRLRKSGAWMAMCDPNGASSYVDAPAHVAGVNGDWRLRRIVACALIPLIDEARAQHGDGRAAIGYGNPLLNAAASDAGSGGGDTERDLVILWKLMSARAGKISEEAVGRVALKVLSSPYCLPHVESLLGDAETTRMLKEYRYFRNNSGEKAADLMRELKGRPELVEYLAVCAAESRRASEGEGERYPSWHYRDALSSVTSEGFAEFVEAKRRFITERTPTPDTERIGLLRRLAERLRSVMPAPLEPGEIAANLGAAWIPPRYYFDFARETFGLDRGWHTVAERSRFSVSYSDTTGAWQVKFGGTGDVDVEVEQKYGTSERRSFSIFETALNHSSLEVTKPDPSDPSGKKRVKDPQATAIAWQKRHAIERAFDEWVHADKDRLEELCAIYNDRFNTLKPRSFDGGYLTLPGSNPTIELRSHQKDAVARILQSEEGTLVAHVVGAGKTFTGVAAGREAKRLGKASKPMFVVPNHLTGQWANDFLRLYPDSRVLCMGEADMSSADAARRFWARAAAGDWDAVIVGQSRFSQLHISREREISYTERRKEELIASIREARADGNDFTVKQLEAMRKRMDDKIKKLKGDDGIAGVSFEDLGVDFLFVDEAHNFKNLAVATSMNVAGMNVASSAKCEDLLDKCTLLREQGHGANIVFATGTPVSNTMAELYNMQRYLAPSLLDSQGVSAFTSWASNFGEVVESVEIKPEGTGFQVKQRFAKFHNLPELMSAFHTFADIMTQDDVDLDVPECEKVNVRVEATEEQKALVEALAERADKVRSGGVDPAEDNLLKITSEGRKIALDPKLIDPDDEGIEPLDGGKVEACALNVFDLWRKSAETRGTQLVFCDTSTPASGKWNVYADLKRRLVELGVPEGEVAFVSDAGDNPRKRDMLFERVNKGEVRVLLGSTQKLGTGTNVQTRLVATHDLDCPWRPSDLEQRLGRIVRQGNMNARVQAFRYVTAGTFDSYLYQTVERKQHFISQVFSSKSPAREAPDLDESVLDYATIKALAAGDATVRRRMELENRIAQLQLLRQAHAAQKRTTKSKIDLQLRPACEALEERIEVMSGDKERFKTASKTALADKQAGSWRMSVGGKTYFDRKDAARAIIAARPAHAAADKPFVKIGSFYGLDVALAYVKQFDESAATNVYLPSITLVGEHPHTSSHPLALSLDTSETCVRQLERVLDEVASCDVEKLRARALEARRNLESAQSSLDAPWDGEGEYKSATSELAELVRQNEMEQARKEEKKHGMEAFFEDPDSYTLEPPRSDDHLSGSSLVDGFGESRPLFVETDRHVFFVGESEDAASMYEKGGGGVLKFAAEGAMVADRISELLESIGEGEMTPLYLSPDASGSIEIGEEPRSQSPAQRAEAARRAAAASAAPHAGHGSRPRFQR